MRIVRASTDDAAALTDIAFAAKRHWNYPEQWIESWRELLTVQPAFIASHETFVAMVEDRQVAFYALERKEGRLELMHLWVLPDAMGQGIGRALFRHALERTRELGFRELEVESDPNAEGFYQRMGARRIGSRTKELGQQRRELPILVFQLDHLVGHS